MLIEAAKGGHVNVVNLLLDWPNNMLASTTDVTQLSPPHSQLETVEVCSRSNDFMHVHTNLVRYFVLYECYISIILLRLSDLHCFIWCS